MTYPATQTDPHSSEVAAARAPRPARSRANESGAALVEFALIFPLLAMLLFGTINGGLVLNRRMDLTQASRESARYGATVAQEQCTPTSGCGGRNWAQQVQTIAVDRANGTVATADVCVALVQGPGSAPVPVSATHTTRSGGLPCYVDNSADSGKRVQVMITKADEIQAIIVTVPVNMTAKGTSRFEG